jgi:hypothetical protein
MPTPVTTATNPAATTSESAKPVVEAEKKATAGIAEGSNTIAQAEKDTEAKVAEKTSDQTETKDGFVARSFNAGKSAISKAVSFVANQFIGAIKIVYGFFKLIVTYPFSFIFSSEESKDEIIQTEAEKKLQDKKDELKAFETEIDTVGKLEEKDAILKLAEDKDIEELGLRTRTRIAHPFTNNVDYGRAEADRNPLMLKKIILERLNKRADEIEAEVKKATEAVEAEKKATEAVEAEKKAPEANTMGASSEDKKSA